MEAPVYMVAIIDVKDYAAYGEQYGMPVGQMFAEVGAEILVATPNPEVLEGDWPGNWTVIVKVPSARIARELYESDAGDLQALLAAGLDAERETLVQEIGENISVRRGALLQCGECRASPRTSNG